MVNRKRREGIILGHESTFEGEDCVHSGDGFIVHIYMTKVNKLYVFNICNSLYANCTSLKL